MFIVRAFEVGKVQVNTRRERPSIETLYRGASRIPNFIFIQGSLLDT